MSSGYSKIVIENTSKIRLDEVCLIVDGGKQVLYDMSLDRSDKETRCDSRIDIGSLLPGSKCVIRVWTYSDISDIYFGGWRDAIKIQAKEYDKISYFYPVSRYIRDQYSVHPRVSAWKAGAIVGLLLSLVYLAGERHLASSNASLESALTAAPNPQKQ